MHIAIFNWRDIDHPKAGGAEVATDQLARGLVARGHRVTFFTSAYPGAKPQEERDGYRIIRRGSELTCRLFGLAWLWRHRGEIDFAVDEVNTLPFLSRFVKPKRHLVWMHQLAREAWLIMAPPVIGHVGYALEPAMFLLYRSARIVTISQSSARTFREFGLRGPIHVAEISLRPPVDAASPTEPYHLGHVGRIAPSKRIDHIFRAMALLAPRFAQIKLTVVGTGAPGELERLQKIAAELGIADRVAYTGFLSNEQRDALTASFDAVAMASVREGWGLVVSEAARFGVPAVVYPVPGLVDSVKDGESGIVCSAETPEALADGLARVLGDRALRERLSRGAKEYLLQFDEERFVGNFERALLEQAAAEA
ncbi:MAG TPA: glycosyltransferase family 4 protein [Verrucomicrobiae bacterium]|nr:glycosyltransferase family 4 protein [Verrucomicrobiae bacterium]